MGLSQIKCGVFRIHLKLKLRRDFDRAEIMFEATLTAPLYSFRTMDMVEPVRPKTFSSSQTSGERTFHTSSISAPSSQQFGARQRKKDFSVFVRGSSPFSTITSWCPET